MQIIKNEIVAWRKSASFEKSDRKKMVGKLPSREINQIMCSAVVTLTVEPIGTRN